MGLWLSGLFAVSVIQSRLGYREAIYLFTKNTNAFENKILENCYRLFFTREYYIEIDFEIE